MAVLAQRAVAVPTLDGATGSAMASTAAAKVRSLSHLLAECPRPAVVCLAIQNIPCDFIPSDPLAKLVDIHASVIFDEFLGTVNLIHFLQKAFQSFDQ